MKTLHYFIIVILLVTLFPLSNVSVQATNPFKPEYYATIDKTNYNNAEHPLIVVSGTPNTSLAIKIRDFSDQEKFSDVIKLGSNGTARYSLNVTSYTVGVYHAFLGYGFDRIDLGFSVGLMPSGSRMVFKVEKDTCIPGDNVTITGYSNPNMLIQISLKDPTGLSVSSIKVTSDYTGHFSSSDLMIPQYAMPGSWSISATSGVDSIQTHIKVNPSAQNGITSACCYLRGSNSTNILQSPLKQFKSGIASKDVKCENNLQLIIKAEDGSPACVKPDTAIVLVNHGWATNVLQPNPMVSLNNDTGIATLKNQAYYFETANYTDDAYHHPVQISFHDVIFTLFPSGFRGGLLAWGCGGSYYWTDAKFSDGTSELLQIFVGDQQCFVPQPVTHFSNHTNPQAGLTFYDGKMKLLVSTDNQDSSALKLSLTTNSTTIRSGQAIGIDISLNNTSSKPLTLTTQDHWPGNGEGLGGCSFLPVGIAIAHGYYTEHNMTDAKSLSLYFLPPCPPALGIKSFTFQPMSNQITAECKSADFPAPCPPMVKVRANVAYSSFLENQHFLDFNTGVYTIMGGDEWGHIAIQHFTVTNSTRG